MALQGRKILGIWKKTIISILFKPAENSVSEKDSIEVIRITSKIT